jgi:hypothetical protein
MQLNHRAEIFDPKTRKWRSVAKQLGMTVRNVQRLARAWQQTGCSGIVRRSRCDRGEHRVDAEGSVINLYDFCMIIDVLCGFAEGG